MPDYPARNIFGGRVLKPLLHDDGYVNEDSDYLL